MNRIESDEVFIGVFKLLLDWFNSSKIGLYNPLLSDSLIDFLINFDKCRLVCEGIFISISSYLFGEQLTFSL